MLDPLFPAGSSLAAIPLTVVVALGFCGLGRLAMSAAAPRSAGTAAFDVAAGWAITTALLIVSSFVHLPLALVAWASIGAGLAGLVLRRAGRADALREFAIAAALCLPLLLIVAASPPIMSDELSHWLPNARFVFDHGALPTAGAPNGWSTYPAYPYGGPFVNVIVSLMLGQWTHTPSALFTVLFYGLCGLAIAAEFRAAPAARPPAAAGAIGVLWLTLLNPTFDPRIALSAHMDSASGLLAGLEALALWHGACAAARGEAGIARTWWWRGGLVAFALVSTRETNPALLAGLWIGLAAATPSAWRHPAAFFRQRLPLIAPPAAGFVLWRTYRAAAGLPPLIPVRPLSEWQWDAGAAILRSVIDDQLPAHPVLGPAAMAGVLLTLAGAVWTWRRDAAARRLLVITAVTAVVWVAFLFWSYVATATPGGVATANSLWRFLGQLGPLLWITLIPLGRAARDTFPAHRRALPCGGAAAAAVMVGVPLLWPALWQNACRYPDVTAARRVAMASADLVARGERVLVVHTVEALWLSHAVRYDLAIERALVTSANVAPSAALPMPADNDSEPAVIFDLRAIDRDALKAGGRLPAVNVYRRERSGDAPGYVAHAVAAPQGAWGCSRAG